MRELGVNRVFVIISYGNLFYGQRRRLYRQVGVVCGVHVKIHGLFATLYNSVSGRVSEVLFRVFGVEVLIRSVNKGLALRVRHAIVSDHVCLRPPYVGRQT